MPGIPVIINFGAPFDMIDPETGRSTGKRGSFVAGLHNRYVLVDSSGIDLCLQIKFTPIGAHRFFRTSMDALADRTIELADVLGTAATSLMDRLASARDWGDRFDLLDTILIERTAQAGDDAYPEVTWAWQQLSNTHGLVRISELTDAIGWSCKRLGARFREQIGLSPEDSRSGHEIPAGARTTRYATILASDRRRLYLRLRGPSAYDQ